MAPPGLQPKPFNKTFDDYSHLHKLAGYSSGPIKDAHVTPTRISRAIHEAPPEYRILDSTDDWYLLVDEDYAIIWANSALRRAFGAPEDDLGKAIHALGGDRDLVAWILAAFEGGCEASGVECRLRGPGGEEEQYLCSVRRAPSGGEGWLLRFREIPDAGGYGAIIEYTGVATILIEDDATISVVNTEFERLSGYPRKEIVGVKRLTDFIADKDERRRFMGYHTARRDDPAAAPKNHSFSFMDRSGDIHIVEITIGMIPGVNRSVMSLLDVTERKRAEQALRENEERLNLAFTAANDGLIDWDLSTGAIFCSARCFAMLGYDPGATVPAISSFLSIVHPDDRTRLEEALNDMVAGERDRLNMESRAQSASGRWIYVLIRLQVVSRDADGTPLRIAGTHTDITERKEAERELLIRDKAMESSLGAIALCDLGGRIIYVNRATLTLHGWEREEIMGEPFSMIWADREEGERTREEALRSGAWLGEIEAQRSDGTTFPVQLAISVVTSESGEPLYLMGSGIDISRWKLAEQDLRVRDMAIASSLNAFTIADLDGRLTYTNQAFLSMWGYASETEVLGRSITEFWQDEEAARDALRVLLDSGRYVAERIGRRRDGTGFYVMYSGSLVTNDAGDPIYLMASIADITDLKRAEAEIQAHNRELSILNQIIGVSASATDIDEALKDVLEATIALLDLRGGGVYLVKPDRRSARLACVQGLPEGLPGHTCIPNITAFPYAGALVAGDVLFIGDPEESSPLPYAAVPITASGEILGSLNLVPHDRKQFTDADRSLLAAIGREIGSSIERMLLIRQLEEAKREANLYLDILSHDIRNAENISGLYTDLLISTLEGEPKEYAQRIRSSIRKSIEILRNVSTIRRIHHESAMLVPIDLDGVIRNEIGIFSEISFHYGGTDLAVMADPLLSEVFTNLIGNAIKFGGPTVEVTIRVEEIGDAVQISVEDTGPGIPDEVKETVFTRFGKNRSRKSGQGLGLYITRMLIERYGGRIWVDDRVPGRPECGAALRLTLRRARRGKPLRGATR